MKCRCPACGASFSLDALLGHSDASQAFLASLNLLGDLSKPLIKYLAMFRPEQRDLTFERASKLLNELAPDILSQQIYRNKHAFPAPKQAWIWAIGVMLERREQGKLQLPLKNHGYLFEVISSYKPEEHQQHQSAPVRPAVYSQPSMLERMQQKQQEQQKSDYERHLEEHEQLKHQRVDPAVSEVLSFLKQTVSSNAEDRSLKGVEPRDMIVHLKKHQQDGETLEDCFQRLKKLERESEENVKKS